MGISRESLGQIRNILRKLDDSIDDVREKRLSDNQRRLMDRERRVERDDESESRRMSDLDRQIG